MRHRTVLEKRQHRLRVEAQVAKRIARRRRWIAVRGEVEGRIEAASPLAHRLNVGWIRQVAVDRQYVRETLAIDEPREIERLVVRGDDLPLARRADDYVSSDESRCAGDEHAHVRCCARTVREPSLRLPPGSRRTTRSCARCRPRAIR